MTAGAAVLTFDTPQAHVTTADTGGGADLRNWIWYQIQWTFIWDLMGS